MYAIRSYYAYRWSRLLWGQERHPPTFHLVSWLFLRLLGLTFLAAFVSIGSQITGLVGSDGILPLPEKLRITSYNVCYTKLLR